MELVISPNTNNPTGSWRNLRPIVDQSRCTKCLLCQTYCPDSAIYVLEKGAAVDYDFCKGCGVCQRECPVKCISMQEER